jgi:hypothetical protein
LISHLSLERNSTVANNNKIWSGIPIFMKSAVWREGMTSENGCKFSGIVARRKRSPTRESYFVAARLKHNQMCSGGGEIAKKVGIVRGCEQSEQEWGHDVCQLRTDIQKARRSRKMPRTWQHSSSWFCQCQFYQLHQVLLEREELLLRCSSPSCL